MKEKQSIDHSKIYYDEQGKLKKPDKAEWQKKMTLWQRLIAWILYRGKPIGK
jgi:hypothetical protein